MDSLRSIFAGCLNYGDEVKADTMLHGVLRGISVPPTANPVPTVPRPHVRLCIYIIAYERTIQPLVFSSSAHC
jgi:hypothetical protein